MKIRMGIAFIAAAAITGQETSRSVWDGVYNEPQAQRGKALYSQHCASCHGALMSGGNTAPPLTGSEFLSNWNGLTASDLFDRIRNSMPPNAPGSLNREVSTDITAFVLKLNRFPEGTAELDRRSEILQQILIEPAKQEAGGGAPNSQPNPYRTVENWFRLPEGRTWGSTNSISIGPDGNIWIAERCGANSCAGKTEPPVLEFDPSGKLLKSFGAGMFIFPHSLFVDRAGNVWVADGQGKGAIGHQVTKLSPNGTVLMKLGKAGVAGDAPDTLNEPNAVVVAPDGSVFVSDGHTAGTGNARVLKFTPEGKFIRQWGGHGSAPGQFEIPHALALDSRRRLFVADRGNNRIQIFDQNGRFLDQWTQFGRPSGICIDKNDVIYVADSESRNQNHPGWKRGIRIGSAKDGSVTAFIPDPETDPDRLSTSAAEGLTVDAEGNIYGAEVGPKGVKKYVRK